MRDALIEVLTPIQKEYEASSEWQDVALKAYPPAEVKKKEKKVKNRGTGYPGAAAAGKAQGNEVKVLPDGHIEGKEQQTDKVNVSSGADAAMKNLDINGKEGGS